MAAKDFSIEIFTPKKRIFSGSAVSVIAPAALGYLGILHNHAPLMTTLVPGNLIVRDDSGETKIFKSQGEGFLEVFHNKVTVLAEKIAE